MTARQACEPVNVELVELQRLAGERRTSWERLGATRKIIDGPDTDKPAAWLITRAKRKITDAGIEFPRMRSCASG